MTTKRIPLKIKLAFFSTLLVVFVASSLSYYIRVGQKKAIVDGQAAAQTETVQRLRQVSREAILMDDDTDMVNYMSVLKESPVISYAMVLDKEGRVRVHSDPLLIGTTLDEPASQLALAHRARQVPLIQNLADKNSHPVIDLSLPILIKTPEEFDGTARIGFDKEVIDNAIAETLHDVDIQLLKAFAIALILGLIGAYLLALFMTRPIETLRQGAKLIGEGQLTHRIQAHSRDELEDLANEFNVMAAKLAELDEMKRDFVSNVTHELRSPMTSIRGYLDLLLNGTAGAMNDLQKDYVSIIKNSSVRLGRFIDNLLDVAKIEAHKLKLVPEELNVFEAAHEMEALFKPQLDEKKIKFTNAVFPHCPRAFVDKDKMAEVLINLTSNAIKFTPENGEIRLAATEGSKHVELVIEDSGIGIPKDMQDKLFNKFEQVKHTQGLARNQKGTGLGLAIAKGIVEAHGGKIWIESPARSGKGTAFHFTIPKLTDEIKAKVYGQS